SREMTVLFPAIFDGSHQRVGVTTIDVVLERMQCDVWKIDVEGMEPDVIRGAGKTLQGAPPRVILAELYDPFVHEVIGLLPSFEVRRVALARADYTLRLLEQIGGQLTDEFCPTSPTYVFTRRK